MLITFSFPLNAQELPLEMVVPLTDLEVEDLTEVSINCQCSQNDIKPIWKKVNDFSIINMITMKICSRIFQLN